MRGMAYVTTTWPADLAAHATAQDLIMIGRNPKAAKQVKARITQWIEDMKAHEVP